VPEEFAGEVLVGDRGVPGADAQIGGREHDAHRGLAEVVLEPVAVLLVLGLSSDEGDGRCGQLAMLPAPIHTVASCAS
jgi:hypothetical protein